MTKYKNLFPVEYNQEGDHNKFSSFRKVILVSRWLFWQNK